MDHVAKQLFRIRINCPCYRKEKCLKQCLQNSILPGTVVEEIAVVEEVVSEEEEGQRDSRFCDY